MVNFRLKNRETEDPKYPKFQFPAPFLCPKCRNNDLENSFSDSKRNWPKHENFNEVVVKDYLFKYYSNIKPIEEKQEL